MSFLEVLGMVVALAGPVFWILLCSAMYHEVEISDAENRMMIGAAIGLFVAGIASAQLAKRVLARKLWAYYALVGLYGVGLAYMVIRAFIYHSLAWYVLVGPAIFYSLMAVPFSSYRRFVGEQEQPVDAAS